MNVNVRDRDGRGWTGLMHAAEKGYVVMVPMLLEAGAGPNIRALNGACKTRFQGVSTGEIVKYAAGI